MEACKDVIIHQYSSFAADSWRHSVIQTFLVLPWNGFHSRADVLCATQNRRHESMHPSMMPVFSQGLRFLRCSVWPACRHGYDSDSNHESTQNQMFFYLSHELIWIEKWRSTLSHESIWINTWRVHLRNKLKFLESRLSHELNRFTFSRYCLSHELIRMKALDSNARKRSTKFSESPKKVNEI